MFKLADAALHIEHIFVELAAAAVALAALGFKRELRLRELFKLRSLLRYFVVQRGDLRRMRADLTLRLLARGPVLPDERAPALLIALHLSAQAL